MDIRVAVDLLRLPTEKKDQDIIFQVHGLVKVKPCQSLLSKGPRLPEFPFLLSPGLIPSYTGYAVWTEQEHKSLTVSSGDHFQHPVTEFRHTKLANKVLVVLAVLKVPER